MRVGIMQPYFFLYLGHFGLIASVDEWVLFDVTQYTPRSWINRNRGCTRKKAGTTFLCRLPTLRSRSKLAMHGSSTPAAARRSVLGKLSHYRRPAPYYDAVVPLVEDAFADCGNDSLVHRNARGLGAVCHYLGLPFRFGILSELGMALPANPGPGGWAPVVCERLGAVSYVDPAGGRALFDPADFAARSVELLFAETEPLYYETGPFKFVPELSILDVLMWNAPERVVRWLRDCTHLTPADQPRESIAGREA